MEFVTRDFYQYIIKVVDDLFKNLKRSDKDALVMMVANVINTIALRFDFDMTDKMRYFYQFTQNNNRDILAIVNMLLPFISDIDNFKLYRELSSFEDLYTAKKEGVTDKSKNQYKFTNTQFHRSIRGKRDEWKDRPFNIRFLEHNQALLLDTIQTVSNKLLPNWINVRPRDINFKDTQLYQKTKEVLPDDEEGDLSWWHTTKYEDVNRFYNGLYAGDIYNTIANDLFNSVRRVKWLLFPKLINNRLINFITILDDLFPLDSILLDRTWEDLLDDQIDKYNNKWIRFVDIVENNKSWKDYDNRVVSGVFVYLIRFFDKFYTRVREIKKDGTYTPIKGKYRLREDDEYESRIDLENINAVLDSIRNTSAEHIYTYLHEAVTELKRTWYGKQLFDGERIVDDVNFGDFQDDTGTKIPLKFVYNFAKSLCIKGTKTVRNRTELVYYQPKWISLSASERDFMCGRLNDPNNNNNWFNIRGNIRRVFDYTDGNTISNYNNWVYKKIRNSIVEVVFEAMIKKGLLSEFVPDPYLTDQEIISTDYVTKNRIIKENLRKNVFSRSNLEKYKNAYYYLTQDTYGNLPKQRFKSKGGIKEKDYFTALIEEFKWHSFYTMDWLAQISFFHHYINNRVIFVTGATGQGKSTQVPKLLLYALKMIDYNDNGKIICTQPRIAPTKGVSTWISKEMGVPIKQVSKTYGEEVSTEYTYVQYKHSHDAHVNPREPYFVRMVTDGTLIEELAQNPILKTLINAKDEDKYYSTNNVYDIVIVDEAHEHNTNMDLILTVMRNTLYYNNSIKLVIVSATMDADEPIYRRYFRNINDNLAYPINQILKEEDNMLDRINVDRRFHISPPGETTQHKVADIYLDRPVDTFEGSHKESIITAINIANTTSTGDILVFSVGKKEIHEICGEVNSNTRKNVICLPFYSEMQEEWRDVVENIDKEVYNITVTKNDIVDVCSGKLDENEAGTVAKGMYNRAIIVATNVAEASITINSLRYVVDNGYFNKVTNDMISGTIIVEKAKISESSRVQRRGRVGRVADGTVYYMYMEGTREDVKEAFNITINDVHMNLYKLFANTYDELPFMTKEVDPNRTKNIAEQKDIVGLMKEGINNGELADNNYIETIKKQFYIDDKLVTYDGHDEHNDYTTYYDSPPQYYETGFKIDSVLDLYGEFYIVHPNEDKIVRNMISGKITKKWNAKMNDWEKSIITDPRKILAGVELLENKLKMVNHNIGIITVEEVVARIFDVSQLLDLFKMEKTIISRKMDDVAREFDFSSKNIKDQELYTGALVSYLYSRRYQCDEEVLALIAMLTASGYSVGKYYVRNRFSVFKNLWKNSVSDYLVLLDIFNNFKKTFNYLPMFTTRDINIERYSQEYEKYKKKYLQIQEDIKKNRLNPYDVPKDFSYKNYMWFKKQDRQKNLYKRENVNKFIQNAESGDIINEKDIEKWCKTNAINSGTMQLFLKIYDRFRRKTATTAELFEWCDEYLPIKNVSDSLEERVLKSFIHGFPQNLAFRSGKDYKNIFYFDETVSNKVYFKKISPWKPDKETVIRHKGKWIMYNNKSVGIDDGLVYISMITNIQLEWLLEIAPTIYNTLTVNIQKHTGKDKILMAEIINKFKLANCQYLLDGAKRMEEKEIQDEKRKIEGKWRRARENLRNMDRREREREERRIREREKRDAEKRAKRRKEKGMTAYLENLFRKIWGVHVEKYSQIGGSSHEVSKVQKIKKRKIKTRLWKTKISTLMKDEKMKKYLPRIEKLIKYDYALMCAKGNRVNGVYLVNDNKIKPIYQKKESLLDDVIRFLQKK